MESEAPRENCIIGDSGSNHISQLSKLHDRQSRESKGRRDATERTYDEQS